MEQAQDNTQKKRKALSIAAEASLVIVASLVTFALVVGFASQYLFHDVLSLHSQQINDTVAVIARDCVSGDELDEYLETKGTSEESQAVLESLQAVCDDADFNYLSLIKPDFENNTITYILSVQGQNHTDLQAYSAGQVEDIDSNGYRQIYQNIANGTSTVEYKFHVDANDSYVAGFVPVHNSQGEVVGILYAESSFAEYRAIFYSYIMFLGVMAFVILAINTFIASRLMRARLIRPIEQLSKETERFAESKSVMDHGMDKVMARSNELGQLASSVYAMEQEIADSIDSIEKMTAERERVNAELDIASAIQEAALPHEFPAFPERREFDLYASADPAKEVGGDFYDFFLIDDDHLALVMADVSGKGVPAALFMMVSKVTIDNHATMLKDPAEIMSAMNNKLSASNDASMFVTIWLGILEISTGTLRCCNAGHEYPVLRQDAGQFQLLRDDHGLALGLMEDAPYTTYTLQLQEGDNILVYTDGVTEARNAAGELYGMERLVEALNSCPQATAEALVGCVKQDVARFAEGAEQFDDLTVLAFRYLGA